MGPCKAFALDLNKSSHCHGDGGEDEPDTVPLEVGDAGGVASELLGKRDDDMVIHWDDDEQEGDGDDG